MALVSNKKIGLEFSIDRKLVFGIELQGSEVKSLRQGKGSLDGARISTVGSELFLIGAFIPAYQDKNQPDYDTYRTRKILANKKEIAEIRELHHGKNLFCFPMNFFLQKNLVKLECGIGKKLQKQDKREALRKKDAKLKNVE